MKIGEFLIRENYITQEVLDKALQIQSDQKNLRLGAILVNMGEITEPDLDKYIVSFFKYINDTALNEAAQWLTQDEVDKLFIEYSMSADSNHYLYN